MFVSKKICNQFSEFLFPRINELAHAANRELFVYQVCLGPFNALRQFFDSDLQIVELLLRRVKVVSDSTIMLPSFLFVVNFVPSKQSKEEKKNTSVKSSKKAFL